MLTRRRALHLAASLLAPVGIPTDVPARGTPAAVPVPVVFPRDDGPHAEPLEWWYYTGHLFTDAGDRYGFEFVVFKAEVGGLLGYAAHVAITDNPRGRFAYDQRRVLAPATADDPTDAGFDLGVGEWRMTGVGGQDRLRATMPGYGIDLALSATKPPALHGADGFVRFPGAKGYTYYYSRTRMDITGTLTVDGASVAVTGEAWFDHQWGDFRTLQEGGWDWYALQLDDVRDVMLYVVRDAAGGPPYLEGSLVAADGALTALAGDDVAIAATGSWTSPTTGVTYPSGWDVTIPPADLSLALTPTMPDQELDTRASTGVVYWEGEVLIVGESAGTAIGGLGYVESTALVEPVRGSGDGMTGIARRRGHA